MASFSPESIWHALHDAPGSPPPQAAAFGAWSLPGQAFARPPGPSGGEGAWAFARSAVARVMRLRHALDDSVPLAFEQLQRLLGAISLADVRQVLVALVRDMALVWCGSVILGSGAGALLGALGAGVGAIPGAALGAEVGAVAGEALLALFGLKALAESMSASMPRALRAYRQGARAACAHGPFGDPHDAHEGFRTRQAAWELAQGHLALLQALLVALLAMLARGGTARALALHEIGGNARLGPAVARWLGENEGRLKEALNRTGRGEETGLARGPLKPVVRAITPRQLRIEAEASRAEAKRWNAPTRDVLSGNGQTQHDAITSRRNELERKFRRTGDLDQDINRRGARDATLRGRYDALARNGHAVGRHGPRVMATALDRRAMHKVDPMTGTTTDFYTGLPHQASKNATQFTSRSAMVDAEAFARASPNFTNALNQAASQGDNRFAINGLSLEDALGPDYLSSVFGKSRLGTESSPTGTAEIDFTGGTYRTVFRQGPDGYWYLHTMFPEPR